MRVALLAIAVFFMAFLGHLLLWRVRLPRRQLPTLCVVLLGALPIGLLMIRFIPSSEPPLGFWEYAHIALFHTAMSLAYIDVYPGLERRSPRMTIATIVDRAGPEGTTAADIFCRFQGDPPVDIRLAAMVEDAMVTETHDTFSLTPKGRVIGWFFSFGQELARLQRKS